MPKPSKPKDAACLLQSKGVANGSGETNRSGNRDLLEIWVYIAESNANAADSLIDKLTAACQDLAQTPGMGRSREELLQGMRSFPVGSYMIYYRRIQNGIRVLRVLHGARRVEDLFPPSEEPDK